MAPCLALFFSKTTTAKNLNYFHRRNILFTNILFGLLFCLLTVQLNYWGDSVEGNYAKRNHLMSCQENATTKEFEMSLAK